MKKLLNKIQKNFNGILRIFLFLITGVVIVYFFPREGKFQYEFQKGYPWMHDELLIAPFDFSIYKTDSELQAETDSILKRVHPYFIYDTSVYSNQEKIFIEEIEKRWSDFLFTHYSVTEISKIKSSYRRKVLEQIKSTLEEYLITLVKEVYIKGVIEIIDFEKEINQPNFQVNIVKEGIAQEHNIMEVFTQKRAYEFLIKRSNELEIEWNRKNEFDVASFVRNLNLNEFIVPNLRYDITTTDKVKAELVNNISLTRGKVRQGEKIIAKGETVSDEKNRILKSLEREYEQSLGKSGSNYMILLGKIVLVFISIFFLYMFLYNYRKQILLNTLHVSFILFLMIVMIVGAGFALHSFGEFLLFIIPFTLLPILIRTFFDARLALFVNVITILLIGFIAPNSFDFVFMNIMAGVVAVISLTQIYRRSRFVFTAFFVIVTYGLIYLGIAVIQEGSFKNIEWVNFAWFSLNGLLVLLAYPLIFVFEKAFRFLSDTTLMELSDTNQTLLRLLAEKAPGTFQHSMQVANLAEGAIIEIGGNPLLVRTGALYHDIGKMDKPEYFIENLGKGYNPHEKHSFAESARIIISHVEKGVEMALKHNLPSQIIDFIRTHHGTSTVQYFYRSYLKEFPEAEVDIKEFSYPGPKPYSKETAVVMMADSVEAASRSLKTVTEVSISELVENIVNYQIKEGQFDVAPITFKDITTVKSVFKNKLRNIYHARIEYPDE